MMPLSLRRKLRWFPEVNIRETQYKFITNSYGVSEFMIRIKTCIPIKANISVLTSLYLKQMQSFIYYSVPLLLTKLSVTVFKSTGATDSYAL